MIPRILSTLLLTICITWLALAALAISFAELTNLDMVAQQAATIRGE